jgi:hypothetical protein
LFNKVYPNVEVVFAGQPIADFFQTVIARMSVQAPDFDVTYIDWGRFPGIHAAGAMDRIDDYLNQDPGWRYDYLTDVPKQVTDLYRIPGGTGPFYGLTDDGNVMTTFYRKDVLDQKASIIRRAGTSRSRSRRSCTIRTTASTGTSPASSAGPGPAPYSGACMPPAAAGGSTRWSRAAGTRCSQATRATRRCVPSSA